MAYTLFEKGHTVSASDFDNNFKWVGQGNLTPKGNANLEETAGVYDLGSSLYRWNNVHIQNIEIQSGGEVQHCMNLISEVTLSATASSIEFTGLNGETDEIYEIICNIKTYNTSTISLFLNSDSTTNNYGCQRLVAQSTAVSAVRATSNTGWEITHTGRDTTTALYSKSNLFLYTNNDLKLCLEKINRNIGGTYIQRMDFYGYVWNNSDTLTSMKFTGFFDPGTNIQLWSKR